MRELTKTDLENLAKEINAWASDNELGKDWSLFYNGIKMHYPLIKYDDNGNYYYKRYSYPCLDKADPLDYCEDYSNNFIMGMSYDARMYECINGYNNHSAYRKLESLLKKYGLYLELCDSCHCEFVRIDN